MVNRTATQSLEFSLPSDLSAQQLVHERVTVQICKAGATQRDVFCVRLALEEALTNAIRHGNKMDVTKKVFVRSTIQDMTVRIEIQDEGDGFTPESLPDPTAQENLGRPGGRGVLLIRSFMDEASYNDVGNCIVMSRTLGGT